MASQMNIYFNSSSFISNPQQQTSFDQQPAPFDLLKSLQSISKKTIKKKLIKIQELITSIEQFERCNDELIINEQICFELLKLLKMKNPIVEQQLINIIWKIAQIGSSYSERYQLNKFFNSFKRSDLNKKIEEIQFREFRQDEQSSKITIFQQYTIKLTQTLAFIYKFQTVNNSTLPYCISVINKLIDKLIIQLKDQNKIKWIIELNKQTNGNDNIDNMLEDNIYSLKGFSGLVEKLDTSLYFIDNCKIHHLIAQLIHISCPSEINCKNHINLPESEINLQLLGIAYKILGEMGWNMTVTQYLIEHHSIFNHIIPLVIQYGQQEQSQQLIKISSFKSSQLANSCHSTLIDGIILLLSRLVYNNPNLNYYTQSIKQLILALIPLTKYNKSIPQNIIDSIQSARIRYNTNQCLRYIWTNGTSDIMIDMINECNYIKSLIEGAGIGGGNQEQNNNVISQTVSNIHIIFNELRYSIKLSIHSHPEIISNTEEQIEQFGGNEEIDSHLFHSKLLLNNRVKYIAQQAKNIMDHSYLNQTHND